MSQYQSFFISASGEKTGAKKLTCVQALQQMNSMNFLTDLRILPKNCSHHPIMNVLEPAFERQFIFHTYACRKERGTHAAARCLELLFCVIDSYEIDFEGDVRYMDDMVIFGDSIKELK